VIVIQPPDSARIRLIEIQNDRGYVESDPQPQPAVWERMNLPIARGLRGLIYVLWDLSQVDPSDLSVLFAGNGRLRIGFAEIDPPPGTEPSDEMVEEAARRCCDNPFFAFHKPPGTSLVCIQGDWSNVVDAKIKGYLATAMGVDSRSPYSPLYARAVGIPKPWGVTALLAEYTGNHAPLELDWTIERGVRTTSYQRAESEPIPVAAASMVVAESPEPVEPQVEAPMVESPRDRTFATFWEFAVAVNRSDPAALALATNGATSAFPVDGAEVRKLLSTMWFRTVLPRLSKDWRDRLLNVLIEYAPVSDHQVKLGRHTMPLRELTYEQLQEVSAKTLVLDVVRPELDMLITVGRFWGADAVKRFRFVEAPAQERPTKVEGMIDRFLG
jgi:hypothetical protein